MKQKFPKYSSDEFLYSISALPDTLLSLNQQLRYTDVLILLVIIVILIGNSIQCSKTFDIHRNRNNHLFQNKTQIPASLDQPAPLLPSRHMLYPFQTWIIHLFTPKCDCADVIRHAYNNSDHYNCPTKSNSSFNERHAYTTTSIKSNSILARSNFPENFNQILKLVK